MHESRPPPFQASTQRPPHEFRRVSDPPPGLPPVLFRDDHIIVLDKPAGLASVAGIGPAKADCLAARVAEAHPGARIAHRLDRDTSGVIVMALTADAHRELSRQFHDREVRKQYVAVVAGVMEPFEQLAARVGGVRGTGDAGAIDLPMRKDLDDAPRQIIDHAQGKPSLTDVTIAERLTDRTRVILEPHTGRSHQLRVHLKAIGHPIVGDDMYAPEPWRSAEARMLLHACVLDFRHPASGARVRFESVCPF